MWMVNASTFATKSNILQRATKWQKLSMNRWILMFYVMHKMFKIEAWLTKVESMP